MRKIRSALHNLKKNIHVLKYCFVFQVVQQERWWIMLWSGEFKKQQNVDDIYLGEEWNEVSCNLKQFKYSLRLWAKTTKWRALARYCLWYFKESFIDDATSKCSKWSIAVSCSLANAYLPFMCWFLTNCFCFSLLHLPWLLYGVFLSQ